MKKIFAGVVSVFFLFFFVSVPAFAWELPWGKDDPITSLRKSGVDANSGRISTSLKMPKTEKGRGYETTLLAGGGQSIELTISKIKGESITIVLLCLKSEDFKKCQDTDKTAYLSSSINKKWRKPGRNESMSDSFTNEEWNYFLNE